MTIYLNSWDMHRFNSHLFVGPLGQAWLNDHLFTGLLRQTWGCFTSLCLQYIAQDMHRPLLWWTSRLGRKLIAHAGQSRLQQVHKRLWLPIQNVRGYPSHLPGPGHATSVGDSSSPLQTSWSPGICFQVLEGTRRERDHGWLWTGCGLGNTPRTHLNHLCDSVFLLCLILLVGVW